MTSKKLRCEWCEETQECFYDWATGMWEFQVGHGSIASLSLDYIEDKWRQIHNDHCPGCQLDGLTV